MAYQLTKYQGGQVSGVETMDGFPFDSIKNDIKQWVDDGAYDRVEVRDDDGKLVHHYPRVVHAGNN